MSCALKAQAEGAKLLYAWYQHQGNSGEKGSNTAVDLFSELFGQHAAINFWRYIFPPIFYALHGYIATWMAIILLFRPYEAWYIPGTKIQLPWTPGIFPKRRHKLAQAVAGTITTTLLTTADIKAQAEQLVTEENIQATVSAVVDAVLLEFRDTTKLHRLAQDISALSPAFLPVIVGTAIDGVQTGQDQRLAKATEKIFDQVVLSVRISKDQADELSARVMETFVTPQKVRGALLTLLSPQNIIALDQSIQSHASGPYKLLARMIGVRRVCNECKNFLEKEPDESEKVISDLLKRFAIREQIAIQIANFDPRSMPLQTIASLRQNVITFVETFTVEHRDDILGTVKRLEGEVVSFIQSGILKFNPEAIPREFVDRTKRDVSAFVYGYLKTQLGGMLEQAIPKIGVYDIIARKIELFTPQQLENTVKRICQQELHWLELLGGIIGLWLGVVQSIVNFFTLGTHPGG